MILLLDIGNTHTHAGIADASRVRRHLDTVTSGWFDNTAPRQLKQFIGRTKIDGIALCSVVPRATPAAREFANRLGVECLELNPRTVCGVGINYPKPQTIGPDRLANAVAVRQRYGAPAVVIDFGTAVTFDVVDKKGDYVGGIIAPGLAAMTDYLHEKTALLPRIKIRDVPAIIGKNTREAMLIGAVHGYRGLIRGLLSELRETLASPRIPVVATGGYARLMAAKLPEIAAVEPLLTLEGLRLVWVRRHGPSK
jgi:type III pantothenate kinase